jgi:hypothetical protein
LVTGVLVTGKLIHYETNNKYTNPPITNNQYISHE